jgi:hypothetical protein
VLGHRDAIDRIDPGDGRIQNETHRKMPQLTGNESLGWRKTDVRHGMDRPAVPDRADLIQIEAFFAEGDFALYRIAGAPAESRLQ